MQRTLNITTNNRLFFNDVEKCQAQLRGKGFFLSAFGQHQDRNRRNRSKTYSFTTQI